MASAALIEPRELEDVAAYVRGFEGSGPPLCTRIHPADEMYRFEFRTPHRTPETAAIMYFASGRQIFEAAAAIVAWRFGRFGAARSLLDFASGYGRSTRHVVRALEPEKITVAEIDPGAVLFQRSEFGVRGVVSGTNPETLALEGPFDVILASSFFSHLPAARFEAWMARLHGLLSPGGVLIFSVHGMKLLPPGVDASPGIVFSPVSETERLEGEEYGTSYVGPEFVRGVTDRVAGGARLLAFPFGLCGFQDLYVLLRPPLPARPDPHLSRVPWGALEHGAVEHGFVTAQGWTVGDIDERPPDVRLYLAGRVAGFSPGEGARGARRSWSFRFPVDAISPDAVVRVEAESERGISKILVAEQLRPYLPVPGPKSDGMGG